MVAADIATGVLVLGAISFAATLLLKLAQHRLAAQDEPLIEQVNEMLPQTQCAQCGYPGCRPYAQAIVREQAPIDLCPPGGEATLAALSRLLDEDDRRLALDPGDKPAAVARIREADCIGCALCIQACPVDAIIGAPQWMHTVIESHCTGCELCVAPCPVGCIEMEAVTGVPKSPRPPAPPLPCVHCDACSRACPVSLDAQTLYQTSSRDRIQQAVEAGLARCIECRACDAACPSGIPLTAFFRYARTRHAGMEAAHEQAAVARHRFEARTHRLVCGEQTALASINAQKELLKAKIERKPPPSRVQ